MYPFHRHLRSILLSATLLVQVATTACAVRGETRLRIYDRDRDDWHNWDNHEDRVFRLYLGERHEEYREFRSLNDREKSEYWRWRHSHPDDR
jgi:hypothetical protein